MHSCVLHNVALCCGCYLDLMEETLQDFRQRQAKLHVPYQQEGQQSTQERRDHLVASSVLKWEYFRLYMFGINLLNHIDTKKITQSALSVRPDRGEPSSPLVSGLNGHLVRSGVVDVPCLGSRHSVASTSLARLALMETNRRKQSSSPWNQVSSPWSREFMVSSSFPGSQRLPAGCPGRAGPVSACICLHLPALCCLPPAPISCVLGSPPPPILPVDLIRLVCRSLLLL